MSSARNRSRPSGGGSGGGGGGVVPRRSHSPDHMPVESPGLRRLVQKRFLQDVLDNSSKKHPGWKVLIVDEHAMKVLSVAVGMYDIMERKITLVESIDKKRAPFPDMGAIYLLEPTAASIQKLLADFAGSKILYGDAIFLYFLGRVPDAALNNIKSCRPLLKRLKALTEINIDFLAKEERAFELDIPNAFVATYLRNTRTPVEQVLAQKLVTVCATLNEYPHIRYKQTSAVASTLASTFHLKMDEFVSQNPTWWYNGGPNKRQTSQRDRGTLLILDRADDCLTPLMHDFHYQAMVHDLLEMDGDRITFQSETTHNPNQTEPKDVILDERDKVWVDLKGKHIAKVIENLSNQIREIMASSTGSTFSRGKGNMSLSQMAAALKALPEYKEVMSKLSQHMHIAHQCMDKLTKGGLVDQSELEQTLATGKDDEGRTLKLNDLIDRAEELIVKMKNKRDRLRLILICTISQGGMRQQDKTRLLNASELTNHDLRTLYSLETLGLAITASKDKGLVSMLTGARAKEGYQSDDDAEFTSSRYVPPLKPILDDLATNNLSLDEYPSVLPMPELAPQTNSRGRGAAASARNRAATEATSARKSAGPSDRWSKSSSAESRKSGGSTAFTGGRFIVFMVGGLAYPELRVAREIMDSTSREIILGSTTCLSPSEFMDELDAIAEQEGRN